MIDPLVRNVLILGFLAGADAMFMVFVAAALVGRWARR